MINKLIIVIHVYFLIAGFHKVEFPISELHQSETYQVSHSSKFLYVPFLIVTSLYCIYSCVVAHQQIGASSACALSCACN